MLLADAYIVKATGIDGLEFREAGARGHRGRDRHDALVCLRRFNEGVREGVGKRRVRGPVRRRGLNGFGFFVGQIA